MEDAEQVADDEAGGVGVGVERGEGDGCDHGKEHLGAEPDDEREIEKSAQKSLHGDRIQKRAENLSEIISLGTPNQTMRIAI
jgi:hypothetical protein